MDFYGGEMDGVIAEQSADGQWQAQLPLEPEVAFNNFIPPANVYREIPWIVGQGMAQLERDAPVRQGEMMAAAGAVGEFDAGQIFGERTIDPLLQQLDFGVGLVEQPVSQNLGEGMPWLFPPQNDGEVVDLAGQQAINVGEEPFGQLAQPLQRVDSGNADLPAPIVGDVQPRPQGMTLEQMAAVPALQGNGRYSPKKKMGPRPPKAEAPDAQGAEPAHAPQPRPANRRGMIPGYRQALNTHHRRCCELKRCVKSCTLAAEFPKQWEALERTGRPYEVPTKDRQQRRARGQPAAQEVAVRVSNGIPAF